MITRVLVAAGVGLVGLLASVGVAYADHQCTGTIGATEISDNVNVPGGAGCTLQGTSVDGNVIVNSPTSPGTSVSRRPTVPPQGPARCRSPAAAARRSS